ncbi:hypothetical protein ACH5RR_028921 [Cinchona calisaya]|uniref:Wound-responsive family protein n=1 Tax=Cinchona calisaya TaxID=153742 RepID=A0ABD2YTS3_9GENT
MKEGRDRTGRSGVGDGMCGTGSRNIGLEEGGKFRRRGRFGLWWLLGRELKIMSSTSRAAAAVCVGAVQAMKDQGLCRWNYTLRSMHHHAKNNMIRSLSQSSKQLSSAVVSSCKAKDHQEKLKESHVLEQLGSQLIDTPTSATF